MQVGYCAAIMGTGGISMRWLKTIVLTMFASATIAIAATTFNPPIECSIPLHAGGYLKASIVTIDNQGIEAMRGQTKQTIDWTDVSTPGIYALHERLLRPGTGEQWLQAGRILHRSPQGETLAERAFSRALRLNPSLKDEVAEARKGPVRAESRDATAQPASRPASESWPALTPEEMTGAVGKLKRQLAKDLARTTAKLELYETTYFLFYSNLPQSEARKWSAVLDRMYARLAGLFGLPEGENLWLGKAVIVVFLSRDDYMKFEKDVYKNDRADKHVGFCHQYEDGRVDVIFYRAPSDLDFARVLVHETTHGFLHRYRSRHRIPTWANEGLAEVIAFELVPHDGLKQSADAEARSELKRPRPLDKFFDENFIEAFQYPIARSLCEYMIRQDKVRYVDFINGIKDGMDWRSALAAKFGVPLPELVAAFGQSMGVQNLQSE